MNGTKSSGYQPSSRRNRLLFAAYVSVGVLTLNVGLYYFCYQNYAILPLKPPLLVDLVTSNGRFSSYGFWFCAVPALISCLFIYLSMGSKEVVLRIAGVLLSHFLSLLTSVVFIPFSIVLVGLYAVAGVIASGLAVAEALIGVSPNTGSVKNHPFVVTALRMRHQRLSMALSQLFWGMVTAGVGVVTILFAGLALVFTNPGIQWQPALTESYLGLMHDFIMVVFVIAAYYAAGIVAYLMIPAYLEMARLERRVTELVSDVPQPSGEV